MGEARRGARGEGRGAQPLCVCTRAATLLALAVLLFFSPLVPHPSSLAHAEDGPAATISSAIKRTGLPIPRFASLRGEEVNMRSGPGFRYPINWVFRRKGLPVEITAEFDTWRRIRDITGAEGWVHQSNLSGKQRSFIVKGDAPQPVYRDKDEQARLRAQAEPNVQGTVLTCRDTWCRVMIDGIKGWMEKKSIWGVYEDEKVD